MTLDKRIIDVLTTPPLENEQYRLTSTNNPYNIAVESVVYQLFTLIH